MSDVTQGASVGESILDMAKKARTLRLQIARLFPEKIFVDKAWDMMIELLIARETRETLCVKDLIILSGEAPTSAMRRIDRLQEAGLLVRACDDRDHRRMLVALTPKGVEAMTTMLRHLHDQRPGTPSDPAKPVTFRPRGLG